MDGSALSASIRCLAFTLLVPIGASAFPDFSKASDVFLPKCQADASIPERACIYAGENDDGIIDYWYYETFGTDANIYFRQGESKDTNKILSLDLRKIFNENAVIVLASSAIADDYDRFLRELVGAEITVLNKQCGYAISPNRRKIVVLIEPHLAKKNRSRCFHELNLSIGIHINQ